MALDTKLNLSNSKFEQASGDTLYLSGTTVIFKDLKYGTDRSAFFTPLSIVNAGWVTGITVSLGATANNGLTKSGLNIRLGGTLTGDTQIRATGNTQFITLLGSGNAGFGIIAPSARVDIQGKTSDDTNYSLIVRKSDTTQSLIIRNDGNILIGSPTFTNNTRLDIRGISTTGNTILRLANNLNVDVLRIKDDKSMIFAGTSATTFILSGTTGFKGAQYLADYSSSFTPRSLVDKAYVTGTSYITASNGLTKTGGNITLGGLLNTPTTITSNAANQHIFNGTWTATTNNQFHMNFTGSFATRTTANDHFYGYYYDPSINVRGSNQIVRAVYINPSFTSGTADLRASLEVSSSGNRAVRFPYDTGTRETAILFVRKDNTTVESRLQFNNSIATPADVLILGTNLSTGKLLFRSGSNTDAMFIHSNQKVAVGYDISTIPTAKFQIRATGTTTGELFRLDDNALANRLLILDNGNTIFSNASSSGQVTIKNQRFDVEGAASSGTRLTAGNITTYGGINLSVVATSTESLTLTGGRGIFVKATSRVNGTVGNPFMEFGSTLTGISDIGPLARLTGDYSQVGTGGDNNLLEMLNSITLTTSASGTHNYRMLYVSPTYNLTTAPAGEIVGYYYNPKVTALTNLTHYAIKTVSGSTLLGSASANTLTSNTRLDVRGLSTTSGTTILRLADSSNIERQTVNAHGVITQRTPYSMLGATTTPIHTWINSGVTVSQMYNIGAQNWYLYNISTGARAGAIGYTTPAGFPGIIFFDTNLGTNRYDFVYNTTNTAINLYHLTLANTRIGIGMGSAGAPTATFQVRGRGTTTGQLVRFEDSAGTARFTIADSGETEFNTSQVNSTFRISRTTASTATTQGLIALRAISSGAMADGFGSGINFQLRDNSNVDNTVASIFAERTGADNSGALVFWTANAGTNSEKYRIALDGLQTTQRVITNNTGVFATRIEKLTTSADMIDGFGPQIIFQIRDSAAVDNSVAAVAAIRDGGDTTASLAFYTRNGNADLIERARIKPGGTIQQTFTGNTKSIGYQIINTNAGSSAINAIQFVNDISGSGTSNGGQIYYTSSAHATQGTALAIYNFAAGSVIIGSNGVERIRFQSDGLTGMGSAAGSGLAVSQLHIGSATGGTTRGLTIGTHSTDTNASIIRYRKSRGNSISSPTTVVNLDNVFNHLAYPYVSTSGYIETAGINAIVNGTVTSTAAPTDIGIWTNSAGSSNSQADLKLRVLSSGYLGLGANAPIGQTISALLHVVQPIETSGSPTGFLFAGGAHKNLASGNNEAIDVHYNLNRTVGFVGGGATLTRQRAFLVDARVTYTGSTSKTITTASGFVVKGSPVAGTNVTITDIYNFAVTDASDVVEIGLVNHNANFGGLILGSVTKASAPSIGAATNGTTFATSGTNMKFHTGSIANNAIGYNYGHTASSVTMVTGTQNFIGTTVSVTNASSVTVGTFNLLHLASNFTPADGTSLTLKNINVEPTYNFQTNVDAAKVYGFYYKPILTSLTNTEHYAIAVDSGKVLIGSTTGSTARLEIKGTGTASNSAFLVKDNSNVTKFWIQDRGTIRSIANDTGDPHIYFAGTLGTLTGTYNVLHMQHNFTDIQGGATGNTINISPNLTNTSENNTYRAFYYNPETVTISAGTLREYAFHSTRGQILFGNNSSNVVTSGTRLDVRGISGNTFNNIIRLADNNNVERFTVFNNGTLSSVGPSHNLTIADNSSFAGLSFTFFTSAADGVHIGASHNVARNEAEGLNLVTNNTPVGGTGNTYTLFITPTYNYTGGYTGTAKGIYYNPTITSITGVTHYAMHLASGNVLIGATGNSITSNTRFDLRGLGATSATTLIRLASSTNVTKFLMTDDGVSTFSNKTSYSADFSSSFTSRSIPDVNYVTGTSNLVTTNRRTASYTLVASDVNKLVETNSTGATTITIPPNSGVTFAVGAQVHFAQYGTGATSFVAGAGVTIRSYNNNLKLSGQYSGASIVKIATNEWYLFGDLTS